jgi:hypothetical protein
MRLAQISNRAAQLSERYEVPEHLSSASRKLSEVSGKVYHGVSAAGEAARKGALAAYRAALAHPKTSIGGVIVAAALVGGLLWYLFGDPRRPVQRRRTHTRMRAGTERRRRGRVRATRAAAA